MGDMLVRLWELPPLEPAIEEAAARGVVVRRALAPEKPVVLDWMHAHFPPWAAEVDVAFSRQPVACYVAVRDGRIKKGDLVVFEAMGGGFTWGAAVARI